MKSLYGVAGFSLGWLGSRLASRETSFAVSEWLGRLTYRTAGWRREAYEENLRGVGAWTEAEIAAHSVEAYRIFSHMLADYFRFTGKASQRLQPLLTKWRGLEHLQTALDAGRGALLVTGHLGHWELGGTLLAQEGFPMTVVSLAEQTAGLTHWRLALRRMAGVRTVIVGNHPFSFVEIMQALRRNECVAMLVDRPYAESGVEVNMFGQTTAFSTGAARLQEHTGATVLPAFVMHAEEDHYMPIIEAPVTMGEGLSIQEKTQRIADAFAPMILEHPEQWFQFVRVWNAANAVLPVRPALV